MCVSASAPIAKEVLDYFLQFVIPIYEVYGMSENSGPAVSIFSFPGYDGFLDFRGMIEI